MEGSRSGRSSHLESRHPRCHFLSKKSGRYGEGVLGFGDDEPQVMNRLTNKKIRSQQGAAVRVKSNINI